jgi:hypothetical protein
VDEITTANMRPMMVRYAEGIVDMAAITIRSLNNTTVSVIRVILGMTVTPPIDRWGSSRKGRSAATYIHDWIKYLSF